MTKARIYYARVDELWRRGEKYAYLEETGHVGNVAWQELEPDAKGNWLTEGMRDDYESFIPIGNKETKEGLIPSAIFTNYSRGIETTRDIWLYSFDNHELLKKVEILINTYNEQVYKWHKQKSLNANIDSSVLYDDRKIKWSSGLKQNLSAGISVDFDQGKVRKSLYRPFTSQYLYFDEVLIHRRGQFPSFLPETKNEAENFVLCLAGAGNRMAFGCLITNYFPALDLAFEKAQCFPFYTYNEDGTNRRENITDWALEKFRAQYNDSAITKWDIFHYVYALLHHPLYRERYAANLKRELPRLPFAPDFHAFARTGARLAEIHVNYELAAEYPLERLEQKGVALDWRVERMKLSKDKLSLTYNEFLTLGGIPPEVYEYRLGNRSALEWIVDQYQVTIDKRSGITNDPNRADDPEYIVRLIGQVVAVSLETVKIVRELPALGIESEQRP